MNLFQKIVLLADSAIFVFFVWFAITSGLKNETFWSGMLFFGVLALILGNIYLIIVKRDINDWLGLFLKRKALEEKRKIKDLES